MLAFAFLDNIILFLLNQLFKSVYRLSDFGQSLVMVNIGTQQISAYFCVMATINLKCVHCQSEKTVKYGLHPNTGKQSFYAKTIIVGL